METRWGKIDHRIMQALGLSEKESRVLEFLATQTYGKTATQIARNSRVLRATVSYILHGLETRKLVMKIKQEKKCLWRYKRGLELFKIT